MTGLVVTLVVDPRVALPGTPGLWNGSHNYSWNTAGYTRAIGYGLRQFGRVKVRCSTIHVNDQVARARIHNAARRLGIRVRTKLVRVTGGTDYVLGVVRT